MQITELKIEDIVANPNQPRKHFDEESLLELAESIKADGLQEPILVRPLGDKYEIVQGERRYRAHVIAELPTIQVKIRELNDNDAFHLSVIENIQREQMTAIEEAQAFYQYVQMGLTHEQIAKKVSKSRDYVTSRLRLLKLSPEIQDWIAQGKISDGHAKQILKCEAIFSSILDPIPFYHGELTPFEVMEKQFILDFQDEKKISVKDVIEWIDSWRYMMIWAELNLLRQLSKIGKLEEEMMNSPLNDNQEWVHNCNDVLSTARKTALFCFQVSLKFGVLLERLNHDDLDFYFDYAMKKREDIVKPWKIYKAQDEWKEFFEKNSFSTDTHELIDILKQRDLIEEFQVSF